MPPSSPALYGRGFILDRKSVFRNVDPLTTENTCIKMKKKIEKIVSISLPLTTGDLHGESRDIPCNSMYLAFSISIRLYDTNDVELRTQIQIFINLKCLLFSSMSHLSNKDKPKYLIKIKIFR